MGKISTSKLDNGMIGLEITYGGPEAPFGGIDSSGPPMYIDPLSFVDASNFLVVNNCLVAMRWNQGNVVFGDWPTGGIYLDSGHFYQSGQYWNWTLAVVPGSASGSPPTITNTYYIWVWPPTWFGSSANNPITVTASSAVTQAGMPQTGAYASATMTVTSSSSATGNYVISGKLPSLGPQVTNVPVAAGQTGATIAANIISAINANLAMPFTAALSPNATSMIILTSRTPGTEGNGMEVAIAAAGGIPALVMTSAWSGGGAGTGGSSNFGLYVHPVSYTNIGETLYIGGYGTSILKYSQADGSIVFGQLTSYLGAVTLSKYNNMLIAAGVVPGPGTVIQAPEMVLAWSASGSFGIWNPTDSSGNVTGAGFNQFADISDYLTGIFITPGQAIILRTQGIDYITPLSGPSPFDFAHISNALQGEGCQDRRLACQYDQVGMFVGNTNIYQFSSGVTAVGNKIKDRLIGQAQIVGSDSRDSVASPIFQGLGGFNKANVLYLFVLMNNIYIYNATNQTWMIFPLPHSSTLEFDLECLCYGPGINSSQSPFYQFVATFNPFLIIQDSTIGPQPQYWYLWPRVQDATFPYAMPSYVLWPKEEIAHGRDITIDGIYITCAGSPGLVMQWSISGTLYGNLTLPSTASPAVYDSYQIFFAASGPSSAGVTTIKNPQLRLDLPVEPAGSDHQVSIAKISLFGSFDPNQRPV